MAFFIFFLGCHHLIGGSKDDVQRGELISDFFGKIYIYIGEYAEYNTITKKCTSVRS